ncbi:hypothetical protein OG909_20900 [Streptomyces sp. NBC_01754]|uniref:hypothetical protein n=1 Tax=Streptomyces sp. NBC_01754 TaxID=2975930 RepID=UPI002DDBFBB3|nr:hypothetical protein [Streptomyces sp. NBC_01754]WSC94532.1 hypothetical protein OG909_20900 [Streptomyces sp. NBC_01754]
MTDPYRGFAASETEPPRRAAGSGSGAVRPVLWTLLLLCAAGNAVTSSISGVVVAVPLVLGLATLGCVAALVVHHRKQRRA